jgi:hypothetical protein
MCNSTLIESGADLLVPVAHLARTEADHIYVLRYRGTLSRFAVSTGPGRVGFRPLLSAFRTIAAARACLTPEYEVVGSALSYWAGARRVGHIFLDRRFCNALSAASEAVGHTLSEEDRRSMYPEPLSEWSEVSPGVFSMPMATPPGSFLGASRAGRTLRDASATLPETERGGVRRAAI